MTAMILVLDHDAGLRLRRVRVRDRLQTRVRAAKLDAELAAGASPESSVLLALHAGLLCRPSRQRLLAHSLKRIAAAGETPWGARSMAPVCVRAVRNARIELEGVIERLTDAGPVDVQGVAKVRRLVADGTGPVYRESVPYQLRNELRAALAAMEPFA